MDPYHRDLKLAQFLYIKYYKKVLLIADTVLCVRWRSDVAIRNVLIDSLRF
jgi:hypothetical protein